MDPLSDDGNELETYEVAKRKSDLSIQEYVLRVEKLMSPWTRLLGVLLLCGSIRFTVDQYNQIRDLFQWFAPNYSLPSYSAVQRTIFPFVIENCFVPSSIELFNVQIEKQNTPLSRFLMRYIHRGTVHSGCSRSTARAPARIVLPSEWMKMDVLSQPLFDRMFSTSKLDASIESSMVIRDRASVVNPWESLIVLRNSRLVKAYCGSTVYVTVEIDTSADRHIWLRLEDGESAYAGQYKVARDPAGTITIRGTIAAISCVGSLQTETQSSYEAKMKVPAEERGIVSLISGAEPLQKYDEREISRNRKRGKARRFFYRIQVNLLSLVISAAC